MKHNRRKERVLSEQIGRRIAKARKHKHLTQERLAELIGITPLHMSRLETGKNSPSIKTLFRLCQALQVSPADLLPF